MKKFRVNQMELSIPEGLKEIEEVYGVVPVEGREEWERENLRRVKLPYPVKYSFGEFEIEAVLVHWKLEVLFDMVFREMVEEGIWRFVKDIGGSYNYRKKRGCDSKLSTHSWGIAIDINCIDNPFGRKPNQPLALVELWKSYGFVWGGDWSYPDGMHFQYARKY